MKRNFCIALFVLLSALFISFAYGENSNNDLIRTKFAAAIENAKKYQDYLLLSGANHYEITKNAIFIETATRCLEQNLKPSCYNSLRDQINANSYYNGKISVPNPTPNQKGK